MKKNDCINIVSDIEVCLRRFGVVASKINKTLPPDFMDFEGFFDDSEKEDAFKLQKYIYNLLEERGPKRSSGKIDTVCFYESCCISATSWSNFNNGKYSEETIKKIVAGLTCNMEETETALELAGFTLTGSRADRLIKAAIMSGHHNTQDMYIILDYYSGQYPAEVKNYYKSDI